METAATVFLSEGPLSDPPVVCFLFPGAGYARRYFSFDMPDNAGKEAKLDFIAIVVGMSSPAII
jgi:hypothetical protein